MIDTIGWLAEHGIKAPSLNPGNYKLPCPFCQHERKRGRHDKPLSLEIRDDGFAVYDCHHCGRTDHTPPMKGVRPMPKRAKPVIKPQWTETGGWGGSRPVEHFAKRGISEEVLELYDIRVVEKWFPQTNREERAIAFPFLENGEVVNIKYRTADKLFRLEKDAKRVFYGLDDMDDELVVIVEGEIDKLSLAQVGIKSAISVPNGSPSVELTDGPIERDRDASYAYLWNSEERIGKVKVFVLATDNDAKGHALEHELSRRLGRHRCRRIVSWPEGCKDANDVLVRLGKDALIDLIDSAEFYPVSGIHKMDEYYEDCLAIFEGRQRVGLEVGWDKLRGILSLTEGLLVVVTGIPNHGKSTFVDQLCLNMAQKHGWKTGICSFENPPEIHIGGLQRQLTEKALRHHIRRWVMNQAEFDNAFLWLRDFFYFIRTDEETATVDWIIEKGQTLVLRHGIKALVVDPYNEVEHKRLQGMSETEYVSEILSKLKRFAQTYGVTVFVVAHPQKPQRVPPGDPPAIPQLYDISGSAHWANKPDLGIVIYRDPASEETKVIVPKVRWGFLGERGEATLFFDKVSTRFCEGLPNRNARDADRPPWEVDDARGV